MLTFTSANIARKLGSSLLTYAMSERHEMKFASYDRIIPSQDSMPKGGFGNLIALPLQKAPRENGNSVFVDDNLNPYKAQWNFLCNIKKHSLLDVENFTQELSKGSELGILNKDIEGNEPWEKKTPTIEFVKLDFPSIVNVTRANMLYIDKTGISNSALNYLKRLAAFRNPEFYKAQAMRFDPAYLCGTSKTSSFLNHPQ